MTSNESSVPDGSGDASTTRHDRARTRRLKRLALVLFTAAALFYIGSIVLAGVAPELLLWPSPAAVGTMLLSFGFVARIRSDPAYDWKARASVDDQP